MRCFIPPNMDCNPMIEASVSLSNLKVDNTQVFDGLNNTKCTLIFRSIDAIKDPNSAATTAEDIRFILSQIRYINSEYLFNQPH